MAAAAFAGVQVAQAVSRDGHDHASGSSCLLGNRGRPDPARDLPPVRQHALQPRQPERRRPTSSRCRTCSTSSRANGTLFTNDHTILISHTAGGILASLTGLYPDRNGQTVSNSYDYYPAARCRASRARSSTGRAPVDPVDDPTPNMITDAGKTTPAPWVPFTRAGCDVGGVGTANIELENNSTATTGDITTRVRDGLAGVERSGRRTRRSRRPTSSGSRSTARSRPRASARTTRTRSPTCSRTSRAATRASTRSSARSTSTRRSRTATARASTRHDGERDHRPDRQLRLPRLRRDAREEHARVRRADAGERRPGDVRLHLRRARPPRSGAEQRLVHQLGDRPRRDRAPPAAEGLRRRVRVVLREPRSATGSTGTTRCS